MTTQDERPGLGPLAVHHLGLVEYEDGLTLQRLFGQARAQGLVPDTLLLLHHPPVLTLGRGAKPENILVSRDELEARGFSVHETNRGGDVTYHGPGQLVGYPIVKLVPGRQDVRRYVRDLEEALIRALSGYGISSGRISKWTGVWLGEDGSPEARKIAAIGVHLSRWQTSHGFALNVAPDLAHFGLIVPCGIGEAGVTSIARELGRAPPFEEVEARVAEQFASVFQATPVPGSAPTRTVSVMVLRSTPGGTQVLLLQRTAARGGFWQCITGRVEAGESPEAAARRELAEETGASVAPVPLGYEHSFAFGETLPPVVCRETAFAAAWPGGEVRLSAAEHERFEWVPPAEALQRLPFEGLRRALRLALTRFSA